MGSAHLFLSYYLNKETPEYGGGNTGIQVKKNRSISNGDTSNNSELIFPAHTGTHIDFPFHFSNRGKTCSDYPASFWIFDKVGYLSCSIKEVPSEIKHLPEEIELLILKTGFGEYRYNDVYWSEQPVIPASYAEMFKNRFPDMKIFGFDMISLTSQLDKDEGKKAHRSFLLEHEILIVEDMKLDQLNDGPTNIIISPLLVDRADGVPCTVIATIQT